MYTPIRILTAIIALMALAMLVRAVPQGTGIVSGNYHFCIHCIIREDKGGRRNPKKEER